MTAFKVNPNGIGDHDDLDESAFIWIDHVYETKKQ